MALRNFDAKYIIETKNLLHAKPICGTNLYEQTLERLCKNRQTFDSSSLTEWRRNRPFVSYSRRKFSFVLGIETTSGQNCRTTHVSLLRGKG